MGEFAVDWVEIPAGSKGVFQSPEEVPLTVPEGQSFRLVYFDASQSSLHDDDDDENDHRPPNPYVDPDQILGGDKPEDWETPLPSLKTRMAEALQNTTSGRCSGLKGPTEWGCQVRNERAGRSIRSVIESDQKCPDCEHYR